MSTPWCRGGGRGSGAAGGARVCAAECVPGSGDDMASMGCRRSVCDSRQGGWETRAVVGAGRWPWRGGPPHGTGLGLIRWARACVSVPAGPGHGRWAHAASPRGGRARGEVVTSRTGDTLFMGCSCARPGCGIGVQRNGNCCAVQERRRDAAGSQERGCAPPMARCMADAAMAAVPVATLIWFSPWATSPAAYRPSMRVRWWPSVCR